MANNQYVNKVEFGNDILIDLTNDTVAAGSMLSGVTAHDASGATITGSIATKTNSNVAVNGTTIEVASGYYASAVSKDIPGIQLTVPVSGTHSFYIDFPDNAAPASSDDWTRVIFTVDSNGNSEVVDDIVAANGVSF